MTGARIGRPRRADVAARYDLGVEAYVDLWSPIILPAARSVVAALGLRSAATVLDVGTGPGALIPHIRAAAPGATVIGIDPSREMLRAARRASTVPLIEGDAVRLPVRGASIDAAVLAFVLFHLSDPAAAMADVARVLMPGGVVGTVTWARELPLGAYQAWDATLNDAGAPPLPVMRVDNGLDSAPGIETLLTRAELQTAQIWTEDLHYQWNPMTYWEFVVGSGGSQMRLRQLDPTARAATLSRARQRLEELSIEAFHWTGQVVCAVATKPPGGP